MKQPDVALHALVCQNVYSLDPTPNLTIT